MLLMPSYFVTIATDSHQTFAKMCLGVCVQLLKTAGAEKENPHENK